MTAYIVNVSFGDQPRQSLEFKALFAVAMTLFTTTLAMNIVVADHHAAISSKV